ncbi:MAG: flagellar basal body-associated FliL family protein [Pseudomonadota bacterium]
MSDTSAAAEQAEETPPKKSKGMLFGLVGAVLLGGASFFGVYAGIVPLPFGAEETAEQADAGQGGEKSASTEEAFDPNDYSASFVTMREIIISLSPEANSKHLRVSMTLEVAPDAEAQVTSLEPRVRDVLNTFLRAVDEREFEVPRAMTRLRGQMLRRVQLVTPPGTVRDLLIQDFILN